MKRNMNLKATAGILLAQATMLGAIAAPTVTAFADEGDAKQFTVATVRWTDAWPNDFLKEGVMAELEEKAGVDLDCRFITTLTGLSRNLFFLLLVSCRMHLLEVSV